MNYVRVFKKIYFSIISLALISGLLCPQTAFAESLPCAEKEPPEAKLVSFEDHEATKERENELIAEKSEFLATADPADEKEDVLDFYFQTDDEGNLVAVNITGEDFSVTILNDSKFLVKAIAEQAKYLEGKINEITASYENEIVEKKYLMAQYAKAIDELSLAINNEPDNESYKDKIAETKDRITKLEYEISLISESYWKERGMNEKEILQLKAEIAELARSSGPEKLTDGEYKDKGIKDKADGPIVDNGHPLAFPEDIRYDYGITGTAPTGSNPAIAVVKIKDENTPQLLRVDNKTDEAFIIKESSRVLLKAYKSALAKFDIAATPYYKRLASNLEKAQWLWQKQNIDPHLYYGGADGVLNDREMRKMVEESIAYLYENMPEDPHEQAQRNKILNLEKNLRAEYVDPALGSYNKELKQASREFYKSIKDAIDPMVNPFVNKINGGIEVIINLPKDTLK